MMQGHAYVDDKDTVAFVCLGTGPWNVVGWRLTRIIMDDKVGGCMPSR